MAQRATPYIQRAKPYIDRLGPHLEHFRRNLHGVRREIDVVERYFGNRSEVLRNVKLPGGVGEIDIYDPISKIAAEVGGPAKGATDRTLQAFAAQLDRLVTFAGEQGATVQVFLEQAATRRGALMLQKAVGVAVEKVGAENVILFPR